VSENRAVHPVATMCRVLGVSPSGYHAWTRRIPSRRASEDAVLRDRIVAIHAAAHGTYGAPAFTPSLQPRASTWAASAWRGSCALRA
jgi:putative transposase